MDVYRRYQVTNLGLFALAGAHAILTWPLRASVALFAGGMALAVAAEAVVIAGGLLEHELRPQLLGVPVSVVLAWPAIAYLAYRVAGLVVPAGMAAAAVAAVLATALDVPTDPHGVSEGVWRYPEAAISEPRFRGVPWWSFAGWLVLVFVITLLPTAVGA
jgi:putative membrane protein